MCQICAAFRPFAEDCDYEALSQSAQVDPVPTSLTAQMAARPVATLDQFAQHLTTDYWANLNQGPRAFDVAPGGSLTVDLSALSAPEQALARDALQAWTDVTGIRFTDYVPPAPAQVSETQDLPDSDSTPVLLAPGEQLRGTLGAGDNSDWIRFDTVGGETYTVILQGIGLADPLLNLRDANGTVVLSNDNVAPGNPTAAMNFTAQGNGTFYLEARAADGGSGSYNLDVTSGAAGSGTQLVFRNDGGGAITNTTVSGTTLLSTEVNVSSNWDNGNLSYDNYTFQTYLHEIGHTLGLGHAGHYNAEADFAGDARFANDSWQLSVMSYFNQDENTAVNATHAGAVTPMLADILAVQQIYGTPTDIRLGDTVYGAGTTLEGYLGDLFRYWSGAETADPGRYAGLPVAFTLVDNGGVDTVDFSFVSADQRIDLRQEGLSDVGGSIGNMAIARGTVIENATAGAGQDTVTGNEADNRLLGGAGNDLLSALAGDDRVLGLGGADTLYGGPGSDTLEGGDGNDLLGGSAGNDRLLGGGGDDRAFTAAGDDTAYGGDGDDVLGGAGGDDLLVGELGADALWGSDGNDTLLGGAGADTLGGSVGNDSLDGGDAADALWGSAGNDTLLGGAGNDTLGGADGTDSLVGGTGNDELWGAAGNDTLSGGDGDDRIGAGTQDDRVSGGAGNDEIFGGLGHDMLRGDAGNDTLFGAGGDDVIDGGAGNDEMYAGPGADVIVFSGGSDTALFFSAADDRVDLSGVGAISDFADLQANHLTEVGGSAVIDDGAGNALTLQNIAIASLGADDFIF